MVGISMARSTRSGMLVGPGIWRKCLPVCTVIWRPSRGILVSQRSNITIWRACPPPRGYRQCIRTRASPFNVKPGCRAATTSHQIEPMAVPSLPFTHNLRKLGPHRTPQLSDLVEGAIQYGPEQQGNCQCRDEAYQPVRPEHLHVAAGTDHRQPERILGAVAEHQRQREWRQGNADFLEDVTDDAEAEHQPDIKHGVLDCVGADCT